SGLSRRKLVAAALAKSGRSVLLPVWMIRLGIFSVMNLSLFCSTIYRLKMAVRAKEWAPNLDRVALLVGCSHCSASQSEAFGYRSSNTIHAGQRHQIEVLKPARCRLSSIAFRLRRRPGASVRP